MDFTVVEWIQEEKVTLFTADGLIQFGGSVVPRLVVSSEVCFFLGVFGAVVMALSSLYSVFL